MRPPLAAAAACALLALSAAPATAATNNISTGAGTGTAGYNGDGIPAPTADIATPIFVAATPDGGYLIAAQGNARVRKVLPNGTITTVAGDGTVGFSGDTGPATSAQLSSAISDIEPMPDGGFLIADSNSNRVRRVFANGTIDTVAGTGAAGFNGDGIPAATAQLNFPDGVAARADGSFLISDNDNHRIRNVAVDGMITTIAGTGAAGGGGDGGLATAAQLNGPGDVEMMPDGGFLISDTDNNRVRRVSFGGTISAAAGTGVFGFAGDTGLATVAELRAPNGLAVLADGSYLIADRLNNRVRRVGTDGIINTVAGNGTAGGAGDGGPATAAELNNPFGVSVNTEGDYLIADTLSHRVRIVDAGDPLPPPPPPPPGNAPPQDSEPPPPEAKKTANVKRKSGEVTLACPKQPRRPLETAEQIKLGCTIDATNGVVTIETVNEKKKVQVGDFYEGAFRLKQVSETKRVKGKLTKVLITELTLKGPGPSGCPRPKRKLRAAARRGRRLWGSARGRFRTRGKHGSAAVRGTTWLTEERCAGTYFRVTKGRVTVEDFTKRKTRALKRGQSYLAPAAKPASKRR